MHSHQYSSAPSWRTIIRVSRVLDVGVLSTACAFSRPLQHLVYLVEIEVAEQGGNYTTLWNASLTGRFEHQLQQMQHLNIVHPLRHFAEQQIVSHVVKRPLDRLPTSTTFPTK
jgi:hypothetical protein